MDEKKDKEKLIEEIRKLQVEKEVLTKIIRTKNKTIGRLLDRYVLKN